MIRINLLGQARPKAAKQAWEKPTLEEVSQRVMAQPYIRFT